MTEIMVGIAGGDTESVALAEDEAGHKHTHRGPSANPELVGIERATNVLSDLIQTATDMFGEPAGLHVQVGLAGAAATSMQRAVRDSLQIELDKVLPAPVETRLAIADDATIASEAAFEGEPGILLRVDQGSSVLVKLGDGRVRQFGGWGHLLGDEGGAISIGLAALRCVATSVDAAEPTAPTTRAALELNVTDKAELLETVYGSDYDISRFAPTVLEEAAAGNEQSRRLVEDELGRFVGRLAQCVQTLGPSGPQRFKVAGSLSRSSYYVETLAGLLHERFVGSDVTRSGREPVEGGLWMARQAWLQKPTTE